MKSIVVTGIAFATLFTSCVSTQVASLQSTGGKDLSLYMAGAPTPDYIPITYIEASGGIITNKKQLLRKLKQRAEKEPNANALVNVRFGYQWFWPFVDGIAASTKR